MVKLLRHPTRAILSVMVAAVLVVGMLGWYRVSAQPIVGKLGLNIAGPNWINMDPRAFDQFITNVANSGAGWTFLPVVWYNFEPDPPFFPPPSPPNSPVCGVEPQGWRYYLGPSGKCHHYYIMSLQAVVDGLRTNGHTIAMGMYGHPTWAGGGPDVVFAKNNNGSIVYRDHLPLFSEAATDLAHFLVDEYKPAAFSVWNEPNGFRYLSIEPDWSRVRCCFTFPEWEDYARYLLWPIYYDLRYKLQSSVMIIGPELATANNGDYGGNAWDENFGVHVGHWNDDWNDYLARYYGWAIDRWSVHAYGNAWQDTPNNVVNWTLNKIGRYSVWRPIWVTEANMVGGCNHTQRSRANWICNVNRTQWWDQTFWMGASDSDTCTAYNSPDEVTGGGLMGAPWNDYWPKWLLQAHYAVLAGAYYCGL